AAGVAVSPARAALIPGMTGPGAVAVAEALPGLLEWPADPATVDRLRALGVRSATVSEATAALGQLERRPTFWSAVYDALGDAPLDDLADLQVPRAGGGTMIDPRSVLIPPRPDG